ncbi:MAG: TetR/AcrR family transcriptional regulator [Solirubrobacterales bacterium]|nr:TetR/AcrR family transcriptional regulator [Solirubrobacterales bacterium]MBV9944009.1 TetR/AcrR family transcriptional regulator [Solirubrobacterales bacterium]
MCGVRIDRREQMARQTRADILSAARRLFAARGYAATSINDIAAEAGVAVQTIYARLGSKRGMLLALIDLIDEEARVGPLAEEVTSAATPLAALRAGVRVTRSFQECCGDVIEALFTAAGAEPELADAVAEGQRRHREGARITIERVQALRGLRNSVSPDRAQALFALSTNHEAWRELISSYQLDWDPAEDWLVDALSRALLAPQRQKRADHRGRA